MPVSTVRSTYSSCGATVSGTLVSFNGDRCPYCKTPADD